MRRTDMPLTPLDECAWDCCILVCTRDPHGMRASCRAQLLSGPFREKFLRRWRLRTGGRFSPDWYKQKFRQREFVKVEICKKQSAYIKIHKNCNIYLNKLDASNFCESLHLFLKYHLKNSFKFTRIRQSRNLLVKSWVINSNLSAGTKTLDTFYTLWLEYQNITSNINFLTIIKSLSFKF